MVLISLAAAILLWYALSINPKTARSFPFIPAILEAAKRMIDNGALGQDFCSSMISILAGFALGFVTAVPIAFSYGMVSAGKRSSGTMDSVYS